jgi:hypothetical protein
MIIGSWIFVSLLYNGQILPPPNPNLVIEYTFQEDGINRLHYERKDEKGSCDRLALYEFNGEQLNQQVTWSAPHNAYFCDQDPDMKVGSVSSTKAWLKNEELYIAVQMGAEEVYFIWKRSKSSKN